MRIGIVTQDLQQTVGQGRINYELASCLAQRGHEVALISITLAPPLASAPNVTWHRVHVPGWAGTELARNESFALGARRAIRQDPRGCDLLQQNGASTYGRADVNISMFVHAHWRKSPFFRAGPGRGLYARYHRLFTRWNAARERCAYHASRQVVALSDLGRESLIAEIGIDPGRVTVIRPGVDAAEFRPLQPREPNALRAELGVPDEACLILFAGEINTPRKNLDLLLEALARLDNEHHLVVVGPGKGSVYPALARRLGVKRRVHFLGERPDVPALMRGADIFAFASHYDTYGLVVLEALASGVPAVTAPTVGASDVIRNGQNGFVLSSSSDLDGLVGLLRQLAAEPKLAARIAQAGRETAVAQSWTAMAAHYERLYEQLAAEPVAGRPGRVRGLSPTA